MAARRGIGPLQPAGSRRRRRRSARPPLALAALAALVVIAAAAAAFALTRGPGGPPPALALAQGVARAWTHGGYTQIYAALTPARGAALPSAAAFAALERAAATTATLQSATAGRARALPGGHAYSVPMRLHTRLFGTLRERFTFKIAGGRASPRVRYDARLAFPGLAAGERLRRVAIAPRRGILLTRDGGPLSDVASASNILGTVGAATGTQRRELEAQGFPATTEVGQDGLELLFENRLAGRPGGVLYAGRRRLAAAAARNGHDVRTSISPTLQALAVAQLAGSSYGASIVAMEPANGELLAAAGVPLSELQPPGSTFKIVTLSGALENHLATASTVYPYATETTIDNTVLHNSNGEDCGGTLAQAFAVSCNSVFVPLGVRIGARRLVATAQAFGFNAPSPVPGAAQSTIPPASLTDAFEVGSSAIGQAQVLATPLQMLRVAATIALVGRRPLPTFALVPRHLFPRVIPVSVARTVRSLMVDVVSSSNGTGVEAQIPGVTVAGKTGTAQVSVPGCSGASGPTGTSGATGASGASGASGATGPSCPPGSTTIKDDAWFVGFAPERNPRIVVAVLFPYEGAGGTAAAPVARAVLEEGLALTR